MTACVLVLTGMTHSLTHSVRKQTVRPAVDTEERRNAPVGTLDLQRTADYLMPTSAGE